MLRKAFSFAVQSQNCDKYGSAWKLLNQIKMVVKKQRPYIHCKNTTNNITKHNITKHTL